MIGAMSGWGAGATSCPFGCSGGAHPPPAQAGQRLLGIIGAWHSHRAKVGALVPSSHGHPHGVWLCPAPPSPGWGYSQPQLLLSSFSPAASRNSGCLGGCSCVGRAGGPPPTTTPRAPPAAPRRPCPIRRGVSSAPGALALLLPRPHNGTPRHSQQEMPGLAVAWGNHRVMCNQKKKASLGWFWGEKIWLEVPPPPPPPEGLQHGHPQVQGHSGGSCPRPRAGFGDQSRALPSGAGGYILGQGLQGFLWSHAPLPLSPHPSPWSRLWDPSELKVSKPVGFVETPEGLC